MDSTTYLHRYQLSPGEDGSPIALHRGPSGVTYRAEDIETDQAVAVKLMPTYSFETAELQQLEAEARAAQKVNHPNIARLYDFGLSGNDVIFVTELLDGTTLDSWVAEHGPLPAAAVLRIAMQVVSGLAAAAFHSVVHRAIQPANLMIVPGQTPEGEWPFVKVLNFGGVPPTLSNSAVSFGQGGPSPQFAAPEQLQGKPADFRSELYSLGCTMWFLLTGVMPTPGAVDKGGVVPKALRPLLAQLVALDPMQRPQDPVALQQQLNDCLAAVERRDGIARKFGVAPVAAAAPVAVAAEVPVVVAEPTELAPADAISRRALLKPLAIAAAVLLFAGLAALALPHILHSRQTAAEPIGVPVGVSDASPAVVARDSSVPASTAAPEPTTAQSAIASTATNTPAAQSDSADSNNVATAAASPETAAAVTTPSADSDQALVSVVPSPPPDSAADDSSSNQTTAPAITNGTAEPATVATSNAPAASANGTETTPPPAPSADLSNTDTRSTSTRKAQPRVAQKSSDADREESTNDATAASRETSTLNALRNRAAESPAQRPAPTPPRVARAASRRRPPVAREEVRPAEPVAEADLSNAPPVPRGAKRARYLGTTPEGDLIFGLPSNERGYVSPPPISPDIRRARRAKPVLVEPSAPRPDEVLPAEPVEPGNQ